MARVVRLDRSGIGSSDPQPGVDLADASEWAADAVAVLDQAGVDHVGVFAEGWSTHAAVALATSNPERVERLVLGNGYARLTQCDDYPYGWPQDTVDAVVEIVRRDWGTGSTLAGIIPMGRSYLDFFARYERIATSPTGAAAMVRAMYRSDVRALLERVRCPTMILFTGDYAHVGREHSEYLAEHIAESSLVDSQAGSWYGLNDESGEKLVEFLTGRRETALGERALAVVVFSDIVESTAQVTNQGDHRWRATLENLDDIVHREVERFGGRVVKQTGDGHLMTFPSPGPAVSAVLSIRRAAPILGLELRFGLHMGELEQRTDGDVTGRTVHAAARITDLAGPAQVLVSGVVAELLAGTGIEFLDLGAQTLRGLPGEWRVFAADLAST